MIQHLNGGGWVFRMRTKLHTYAYLPVDGPRIIDLGRFDLNILPDNWSDDD